MPATYPSSSTVAPIVLDDVDKSRCRYHLRYSAGVPAGDRARLEEAITTIEDSYTANKVVAQLDRCDAAENATAIESLSIGMRVAYIGDINRTQLTTDVNQLKKWRENYRYETDRLADILWVTNYNDPNMARYRYERNGGTFVNAIPGIATNSAGNDTWLNQNYG